MKFSCLHTHSTFCDGKDDIAAVCKAAYEKGLVSLGFSSHAPLPENSGYESQWHIQNSTLDAYVKTVRQARQEWEGRLRVFLGLEIDYIAGITGPRDPLFTNLGLDYSIGSVHYVVPPNGFKSFTVDAPNDEVIQGIEKGYLGDGEAYVQAYWDAVHEMIRAGGFDILGHMDLVKMHNYEQKWFSESGESYLSNIEETLDLLEKTSIVVELNTGGLIRGKTKSCYPSLAILKMMKARNIPVTINADAHRAQDVDGFYPTGVQTLMEAGYRNMVMFEGRSGRETRWSEVPLEG